MESDRPEVLARGLWVVFGDQPILRDLDLSLTQGARLAIFGPNGAGKTTLLRVLAGAIRPSGGELRLCGLDPARDPARVRSRLGVLAHQTYLYGELTAEENLRLYGRLYRVPRLRERVEELLERVGLAHRRCDRVESFSRGMQQRLAIARCVLHDPAILLLDEPDTGLDLDAQALLQSVLLESGRSRTVIMATHDADLARRLCERAAVLIDGRLTDELTTATVDSERLRNLYRKPAQVPG